MRTILIMTIVPFVLLLLMLGVLVFNPEIEYQIGQAFIKGEGAPKNYDLGVYWLKLSAERGNVDAQGMLGRMYLIGLPVQDLKEAIKYLSLGEKQNSNECIRLLSYAYSYGQGVPQDYGKAIELCKRGLAKDEEGRELMNLSFLTLILPKPYKNYKEARTYSTELTRIGYTSAWAYWCLGLVNEYGLGTAKNLPEAMKWYSRGAKLGDNDSQLAVARMILEGKADGKQNALAEKYLKNAATTQVLDAQIIYALVLAAKDRSREENGYYGSLLEKLEKRGFSAYANRLKEVSAIEKPNHAFAVKLLQDKQSDVTGAKTLVAALAARYGLFGKPDFNAFIADLNAAADKKLPDALTIKANLLTNVELGDPDYAAAGKLYEQAMGNPYAQGQLGMLHALGVGVRHDWAKATDLLEKSSNSNDPESQYMLAGFYCDGRGVPPDRRKAVELFEKAALQGHEDAALEIGIVCSSNEFPDYPQDLTKAEKWFREAAGYHFQEANYYLGHVLMSTSAREAAECLKEAADNGHVLAQLQVARYYKDRDNLKEARKYFEMASKDGNALALRQVRKLDIREATLENHRKAPLLVVAKETIDKGTIIKESMLETIENSLSEDNDNWNSDYLTETKPAIGATAKEDIDKGDCLSESALDFPDPDEKEDSSN